MKVKSESFDPDPNLFFVNKGPGIDIKTMQFISKKKYVYNTSG
jgi:hypothetical protein